MGGAEQAEAAQQVAQQQVGGDPYVNLDRVAALDLTLAGTIKMTLEGGTAPARR